MCRHGSDLTTVGTYKKDNKHPVWSVPNENRSRMRLKKSFSIYFQSQTPAVRPATDDR